MTTTNGSTRLEEAAPVIEVSPLRLVRMEIPIRGISPLIVNRFSNKAMQMMLDSQQGKASKKKPPKDPEADYNASRYILDAHRDGFPAVGFKAAIVDAARFFDKRVTMEDLKRAIFVAGEGPEMLVALEGDRSMREDYVRLADARRTADLRYRAQYDNWRAVLCIDFPASQVVPDSLVAIVEASGLNGIGEWRPSAPRGKTGIYGRYVIDDTRTIAQA